MDRSYVMIDLDDPRTARLAEVMSNSTCKKILGFLAHSELSESELSRSLKVPLNTINYNMKKLVSAGLAEPARSLLSVKGKAVRVYRISHKKIVISPKTLSRGVLPALVVAALGSIGLWMFNSRSSIEYAAFDAGRVAKIADSGAFYEFLAAAPSSWAWFFIGALIALATLSLWNWFKH